MQTPIKNWRTPVKIVAANKYSTPCCATSVVINSAIEPVAAEIMAGRPPAREMMIAIQKEVYSATMGLTLAIAANAKDSGINASDTVIPERTSVLSEESLKESAKSE